MGKSIGKYRTDDSDDPFFNDFFTLQIFAWKVASERKKLPKFFKNQFFHFFAKILLVFLHFSSISSNFLSHVLIFLFAVRFRYAQSTHWGTLIRPPYPPQRSLAFARSYFPPFIFLFYLLRIFINNLIFIKTFINKFKKFLIKVLTKRKKVWYNVNVGGWKLLKILELFSHPKVIF